MGHKMGKLRSGCYYCFKTLDPHDTSEHLRTFVECPNCKALYHELCFRQVQQCLRCGSDEVQAIQIAPPFLLSKVSEKNYRMH